MLFILVEVRSIEAKINKPYLMEAVRLTVFISYEDVVQFQIVVDEAYIVYSFDEFY